MNTALRILASAILIICLSNLIGCNRTSRDESNRLRVAVTTSFRDSGLAERLIDDFESQNGTSIELICVGSGAAIKLAENGDVDVIVVHSPELELGFMEQKHGQRRETFMENSFLILGPASDPAALRDLNTDDAFRKLAETGHVFVSRGDQSGTHRRELRLWKSAEIDPASGMILETGQGMGQTLMIADQKSAYTLCDWGTYLKFKDKISLIPLVQNQEAMLNRYSVIVISNSITGRRDTITADRFADYLISTRGQNLIGSYRRNGESFFNPCYEDSKAD